MSIVHLLSIRVRLTLGLLAVDVVETLSLAEPIDLCASETGDHLFGELMRNWLARMEFLLDMIAAEQEGR